MRIEIKNVKINLTFSEETTMFKADLAINGIIVGEANNDGRGGCTFYQAKYYDFKKQEVLPIEIQNRNKDLIKQAEEFCKSLPPYQGSDFTLDMNLEFLIDNLIDDKVAKKEQKKFEKKMVDRIMWGVPKAHSYKEIKFKVPLSQFPKDKLQLYVDKYKKDFLKGEVFLNTNLESLGIKI